MFFILSKILTVLISPFIWFIALFILSFLAKTRKYRRIFFFTAIGVLWFFSNAFIYSTVLRAWEIRPVEKASLEDQYEYGVVLGGMASFDEDYDRLFFHESVDRLMQLLDLYFEGRIDKIVIAGGNPNIVFKERKESLAIRDYLVKMGIPSGDILVEDESRNTYENAANTAELLGADGRKIILVTSGFHVRRAKACFEGVGFEVDAYPAHIVSGVGVFNPATLIVPYSGVFGAWNMLFKEIIGYLVYDIRGYF